MNHGCNAYADVSLVQEEPRTAVSDSQVDQQEDRREDLREEYAAQSVQLRLLKERLCCVETGRRLVY